jgi:hypothetical protein
MAASNSISTPTQTTTSSSQQVVAEGGSGTTNTLGSLQASHNDAINVTNSDPDAIAANQQVSTTALNDTAEGIAATAIAGLEGNQNIAQSALGDVSSVAENSIGAVTNVANNSVSGANDVAADSLGVLENITDQYAAGINQSSANNAQVATDALQTLLPQDALAGAAGTTTNANNAPFSSNNVIVWTSVIGVVIALLYFIKKGK